MEDLLTPQICMDVDETPLDVGKDLTDDESASESVEPELDDDDKIRLLLEEKFAGSAQVPEELTEFEKDAKRNVFAVGEPAVQFHRLHCTACNVHLGSAPIGHFNRYIHPLLKVLLCKSCYDFYCSGEFDKDEDGSEMYCRWCGQGGKVMCCAQCAYVFCQKCVRQNLGKRTLELIKDSDDWLCFGCNPTQLINLKIVCTSLYEFVQEEIRLSKSLNNIERLKLDHTACCQKVKAAKRKRDDDYNPSKEWEEQQKSKKPHVLKSSAAKSLSVSENHAKIKTWNQKEEAEVVCTPDLLSLMEDDPPPLAHVPKPTQSNNITANSILSKELTKPPLNTPREPIPIQPKPIRADGKKLYTIAPKTSMMMNTNNMQKTTPNFIRLQTPAIKFIPTMARPIVNSVPAQITPGTKHEWYDKAATVVSTITGNLSATLMNLTKEQRTAKTVEQLANIHNKLQELLSSSVNSLIQVRKNLRSEFLADLNKLKFSNAPSYVRSNNMSSVPKPKPLPVPSNSKDNDDDDVIIVNSESSANKPAISEPPPLVKLSKETKPGSRPYLKVRSVSQLLSVTSECITIPDDPPGPNDDVIPVEEKDPLALPDVPEQVDDQQSSSTSTIPDSKIKEKDALKIKNAATESNINKLVKENMKYQIENVAEDELKRILSVRVLLATNFSEVLPENRLKTASWFVETDDNTKTNLDNQNQVDTVVSERLSATETEESVSKPETSSNNKENEESEPMDTNEISGSEKDTTKMTEETEKDKENVVQKEMETESKNDDKEKGIEGKEIESKGEEEKEIENKDEEEKEIESKDEEEKEIESSDEGRDESVKEIENKEIEDEKSDENGKGKESESDNEDEKENDDTDEQEENEKLKDNEDTEEQENAENEKEEKELTEDDENEEKELTEEEDKDEIDSISNEFPHESNKSVDSNLTEDNTDASDKEEETTGGAEESTLNNEEGNSIEEESNSNEEDSSTEDTVPANETNFTQEKNSVDVTNTNNTSKSDVFSSEPVTADSGIEADSK